MANLLQFSLAASTVAFAIALPGALYFRRRPERSHSRLAWWFVRRRKPQPGPWWFFLSSIASIASWSLNVCVIDGVGLHWRAPVWLVTVAGAVACVSVAALCINLGGELRTQRLTRKAAAGLAVR